MGNKNIEYLKFILTVLTFILLGFFWEWVKISNTQELGLYP